jgi:CRP/FNR family transcriptional regulator, cyclic AMP receptor protein
MSYEKGIKETIDQKQELPEKIDIGLLKYFWQSSPITGGGSNNVPKFLRNIDVLKNFTENELRILSKSLHRRNFSDSEEIFRQKESGMGLYFVYQGLVDVAVEGSDYTRREDEKNENIIITLERLDYFGELALLQDHSIRNATAIARANTILLGIFKPDVENLIESHPIVATKLLQSISVIVANRLFSVTQELKRLKLKISKLEAECEKNKSK